MPDTDGAAATTARRPLASPLLLVGLRCIARYLLLPFVLPLLGATGGIVPGVAFGILMVLDVIAVVSILATLRWLWRHQHPRRWQYLPVAFTLIVVIAVFLVNDTRLLSA
jgi:hypothetical protein